MARIKHCVHDRIPYELQQIRVYFPIRYVQYMNHNHKNPDRNKYKMNEKQVYRNGF